MIEFDIRSTDNLHRGKPIVAIVLFKKISLAEIIEIENFWRSRNAIPEIYTVKNYGNKKEVGEWLENLPNDAVVVDGDYHGCNIINVGDFDGDMGKVADQVSILYQMEVDIYGEMLKKECAEKFGGQGEALEQYCAFMINKAFGEEVRERYCQRHGIILPLYWYI